MKETELFPLEFIDRVNDDLLLIQHQKGLKLGTDALLLASYVREEPYGEALELGGGTGIVSFLCAVRKKCRHVLCLEVQDAFASMIRRNITLNGLCDRVSCLAADIRDFTPERDREFDLVFTNPPYMTAQSGALNQADEKAIARHELHGSIDDFCAAGARALKYGGRFYCVYRPDRTADLFSALRAHQLEPKRMTFVHANTEAPPSMLLLEAKKCGKCGLLVTPPLILHTDSHNKEHTLAMQEILNNGRFPL